MKLTKSVVDALRFQGAHAKAKCVYWDEEVKGFGLRVFSSGRKSFFFAYRFGGRQRYLTLGDYGPLTPAQAREMALQRKAEVLRGIDPLATRQQDLRAKTVAELCSAYLERHAKPHNKSWQKDRDRIERYVLPAFGSWKVKGVARGDVARLHHKIGVERKHPTTANRVLALVSSIWAKAKIWGYLEEAASNPARGIERYAEKKRRRFVTRDEMPRLAAAIDAESGIYLKALIWLYLFTGLRKDELRTLRWAPDREGKRGHVDLEAGEITLPDTKGGEPLHLPLSSEARLLLEHVPRFEDNPHVFPGLKDGCPLVNVSKPWKRIKTRAGITDVRLHDLRRTVGSWLAQSGSSLELIGAVLNHADVKTTQIYARFHLDPIANALEAHGKLLREVTKPKKDGDGKAEATAHPLALPAAGKAAD